MIFLTLYFVSFLRLKEKLDNFYCKFICKIYFNIYLFKKFLLGLERKEFLIETLLKIYAKMQEIFV